MNDRSLPAIVIFVLVCHCAFIAFGIFSYAPEPVHRPKARLVVQTIALNEPASAPAPAPIPIAAPPQKVVAVQAPPEPVAPPPPPPPPPPKPEKKIEAKKEVKKKEEKPKVAEAKPKPKPKQEPAKPKQEAPKQSPPPVNPRKNELLAKAQESIAKIQPARDKISGGKSSLKLPVVESNAGASVGEIGYKDELAAHLRLQLKLPEYGEVKIKLTIDSSGRFVGVEILGDGSAVNRKHVEKIVPTLTFPPFGSRFGPKKLETFTITLSNEI